MKAAFFSNFSKIVVIAAAAGLLGGCATSGNPKDPIEGFNRAMFGFNEGLDKVIIKPVATGYEAVLPQPIQTGVANFFSNIADLMIGVNNLLDKDPPLTAQQSGFTNGNTYPQTYDALGRYLFIGTTIDF